MPKRRRQTRNQAVRLNGNGIPKERGDKLIGDLPFVGKVVKLEGVGEVLCHSSENGNMVFLSRTDGGVRTYEIRKDELNRVGDVFRYGHPPLITDYSQRSGRAYGLFERSLRSAKL